MESGYPHDDVCFGAQSRTRYRITLINHPRVCVAHSGMVAWED